jgi:membrane protease YdiL (CAAX protease family)
MFLSFSNSLVEEYYWRGFLLDQLRRRLDNVLWLGLLAGGLFGLHHVFVFAPLLGLPTAVLCTLGTVVAGVVWSWQRLKGWSLLDCYVSHILADLAGLWAVWDVMGRSV